MPTVYRRRRKRLISLSGGDLARANDGAFGPETGGSEEWEELPYSAKPLHFERPCCMSRSEAYAESVVQQSPGLTDRCRSTLGTCNTRHANPEGVVQNIIEELKRATSAGVKAEFAELQAFDWQAGYDWD
jgi:hypothetical protein